MNGTDYYYTYDDNGNMTSGPDFTDTGQITSRTITYNADNMPVQIEHAGIGVTNFVYDGNGVRAKKAVQGGGTTYYVNENFEVINGEPIGYIFAGNLRIAKITASDSNYFHKDHLGSSTVMTDETGTLVEASEYMPFGSLRDHTGTEVTDYKFTDQELDPSTNLYNYDARLYDPVIGRFVSADPIVPDPYNPQSLNRYSYCLNNPLIYADPSGLTPSQDLADISDEINSIEEGNNPNDSNSKIRDPNTANYHYIEGIGWTYTVKTRRGLRFDEEGNWIDPKTEKVVELTRAEIVSGKNLLSLAKKAKNVKQFLKMFKEMHKKARKSWKCDRKDETKSMIFTKKGKKVAEQMQKSREAETVIDAFEAYLTGKIK